MVEDRFEGWKAPEIKECELTKYNWLVQNKDNSSGDVVITGYDVSVFGGSTGSDGNGTGNQNNNSGTSGEDDEEESGHGHSG